MKKLVITLLAINLSFVVLTSEHLNLPYQVVQYIAALHFLTWLLSLIIILKKAKKPL